MDWKEWDGGRHGAEREDAKGKRDAKKRNEGSGEMKEGEGKRTSLPMRAAPARRPLREERPSGGGPKSLTLNRATAPKITSFRDFEMSVREHVGYLSMHILDVYSRFG